MAETKKTKQRKRTVTEKVIHWIGTPHSLVFHSILFIGFFLAPFIFRFSFDLMLLILTTIVSLEAIYLAIFIQHSVNAQSVRLDDVEESLDDVEENLDDIEESIDDVEENLDDLEESIDDFGENFTSGKQAKNHTASTQKLEKTLEQIILELKDVKKHLKK